MNEKKIYKEVKNTKIRKYEDHIYIETHGCAMRIYPCGIREDGTPITRIEVRTYDSPMPQKDGSDLMWEFESVVKGGSKALILVKQRRIK